MQHSESSTYISVGVTDAGGLTGLNSSWAGTHGSHEEGEDASDEQRGLHFIYFRDYPYDFELKLRKLRSKGLL